MRFDQTTHVPNQSLPYPSRCLVSLNMANVTVLHHIEGLDGKNVVLLFGKTRAGKSTFVNDAYGKKVVKTTMRLTSDTNEISYVNEPISVGDLEVYLVDTVGLGGSGKDHDRASFAWRWLRILHPGKNRKSQLVPTVKGILYFIDIMDGATNEDNIRNLETFKALVGEEVLESVVFVTTKWVTSAEPNTQRRLENIFVGWEEKIRQDFPKASILRLDDTTGRLDEEDLSKLSRLERTKREREYHDNAMRVLGLLLTKTATQPILAQKEMYAGGKRMKAGQTTLGQTTIRHLSIDIERARDITIIQQLRRTIEAIKNSVMMKVFFPKGTRRNGETISHK
ncbi:hypothetical protein DL96DRAFT_872478 [Flagelloscypha sp. PMI_526]|nr:hypothetical protein DL96DRAFT_872478 [Flagelloscypha sp. PMI_526]